ncbi:MAG: RsmD family RNA methyltransferase [Pseudomonadota bacterium]
MPRHTTGSGARGAVVTVDDLAHGGDGVARLEGQVYFVRGALPGDRVTLREVQQRRRHALAEVSSLVEASPLRVPATCTHHPACGGCPWHELQDTAQLEAKIRIVAETLRRLARLDIEKLPPLEIAPGDHQIVDGLIRCVRAGQGEGYRIRARLHLERRGDHTRAGYRAARSHHVIDVEHCLVLHPSLAPSVSMALQRARDEGWPRGELHVALGLQPLHTSAVLRSAERPHDPEVLARALTDCGFVGAQILCRRDDEVLAAQGEIALGGVIAPEAPGGPFGHDPWTFTQPQHAGNRLLIEAVQLACDPAPGVHILELHAGAGNLSLGLAGRGATLRSVENAPHALHWLRANVQRAGAADRIEVLAADVETLPLQELAAGAEPDVLLLDPPRTGFSRLSELVQQLRPARVVYVSCDPATLARDLRPLGDLGYAPARILLIDLMPGSWHVETVLLLQRTV